MHLHKTLHALAVCGILITLIAVTFLGTDSVTPVQAIAATEAQTTAAWLWRPVELMSLAEQQKVIAQAKSLGVQTLFVAADRYVTLVQSKDEDVAAALDSYRAGQVQFLRLAHQNGLMVHALGGDSNWSTPTGRVYPKLLLEYVLKHNGQHEAVEQYDGIHFDIEPYSQEGFNSRKTIALTEFLDTAQILVDRQKYFQGIYGVTAPIPVGFAIPYWLDGSHPDMPLIRRNRRKEPVAQHLMRILNQVPGNYITIMAYRDFGLGINGSVELTQTEMLFGEKNTKNVRIYIGQEVTQVEPEHITFFEEGKAALKAEAAHIHTAFSGRLPYQGIAIHHLDSLMALKP